VRVNLNRSHILSQPELGGNPVSLRVPNRPLSGSVAFLCHLGLNTVQKLKGKAKNPLTYAVSSASFQLEQTRRSEFAGRNLRCQCPHLNYPAHSAQRVCSPPSEGKLEDLPVSWNYAAAAAQAAHCPPRVASVLLRESPHNTFVSLPLLGELTAYSTEPSIEGQRALEFGSLFQKTPCWG
jgi:hypothetical protein